MSLRAKTPGTAGNAIAITFADVKPDDDTPADTTADVTITFADRRAGLTPAAIGAELGTPAGGTAPGLVALTAAAAGLPAATPATQLTGSPPSLTVPLEDGSGDAFTLAAADDPLLAQVTVAIEDVDTGAGTFTLVVALDHTFDDAKLGELDGKLGALVGVTAGPGGFAPPAAGTLTLSGGTPAQTSAAGTAQATVLSG